MTTGIYQHYKGNQYEVKGIAFHSETLEEMVVYQALYDSPGFKNGTWWVRPRKMFEEEIIVDGKTIRRFRLMNAS